MQSTTSPWPAGSRPAADIALPAETNSGVFLHLARNDAVFPAHGASAFSDPTHACAGISAGRNGVCVYEHSGDYFAPLLAHAAPLTNWTHVAVVYQDGTPSLYLNGELAHRGLKSRFTVHSGLSVDPTGSGTFKGELGGLRDFGRPLTAAEVAELAKSKPPADSGSPCRQSPWPAASGNLEAEVQLRAATTLRFSDGRTRSFQVDALPAPLEISGPWEVRFPANMDVPERLTLDKLMSLTEHTNEAVRYFSGTAAYQRTFDLPADRLGSRQAPAAGLGPRRGHGGSPAQRQEPGRVLEAAVHHRHHRRSQAGNEPPGSARDRHLAQPPDRRREVSERFPSCRRGGGRPQFKPYLGVDLKLSPDETPAPFGLIGPVQLRSTQRVSLSPR